MNLNIIHQDSQIVVVDKPVGMSVHNAEDSGDLLFHLSEQLKVKKLYPVHRLDKETSGLMILAFSSEAAAQMQAELHKPQTVKKYIAIVRGLLPGAHGTWTLPLTDKAEGRKNPQGLVADRKECLTLWKVLNSNEYLSLLECEIKTGRQHQIRKHAALTKHALIGDTRYSDEKYNEQIKQRYDFNRMALHCSQIASYQSPLPEEFKKIFA